MTVTSDVEEVHGSKDERGDSNEDGPESDEEVRQSCVDDRWVASYIFEDIEPVSLNNDGWRNTHCRLGRRVWRVEEYEGRLRTKQHVQDGKSKSNEKVDHEGAASLHDHKVDDQFSRSARPN